MGFPILKIIVPSEEAKEQLMEESRYLDFEVEDIDSDKAPILMHLYDLPEKYWEIAED